MGALEFHVVVRSDLLAPERGQNRHFAYAVLRECCSVRHDGAPVWPTGRRLDAPRACAGPPLATCSDAVAGSLERRRPPRKGRSEHASLGCPIVRIPGSRSRDVTRRHDGTTRCDGPRQEVLHTAFIRAVTGIWLCRIRP